MLHTAQALADAARRFTWRDIDISSRERLRMALIKKHGSLTQAAECLEVNYQILSDVLGGRRHIYGVVESIQRDMEMTDDTVLSLWPLLRQWPKKSRVAC